MIHAPILGQLEGYVTSLPASFTCFLKDEAQLRQTELSVSVSIADVATDCLAIISDAAQLFLLHTPVNMLMQETCALSN